MRQNIASSHAFPTWTNVNNTSSSYIPPNFTSASATSQGASQTGSSYLQLPRSHVTHPRLRGSIQQTNSAFSRPNLGNIRQDGSGGAFRHEDYFNENPTLPSGPNKQDFLNESFFEGVPNPSDLGQQFNTGGQGLNGVKVLDSQSTKDTGSMSTFQSSPARTTSVEQDLVHSPGFVNLVAQPVSYGLPNMGNTCYMNSVLQCLFNTEKLRTYFAAGQHLIGKTNIPLTESFVETLASAFSKNVAVDELDIPLSLFKDTLETVAPIFKGNSQNDAHEFFRLLIEKIHDELNTGTKKSASYTEFKPSARFMSLYQLAEEWKKYSDERDKSLIASVFGGKLLNEVSCSSCKYVSYTFEDAVDLSLNLSNAAEISSSDSKNTSLYSCLKRFTTPESVEGYSCEKCGKTNTSFKRTTIWKQPEILTVHFKRFIYGHSGERKAVKERISFPVNSMTLDSYTHENSNEKHGTYKLYGIVNHHGSLNNGHYTALIYNDHLKGWLQYNDSQISKVDEKEIADFAQGSTDSYILFYKRI